MPVRKPLVVSLPQDGGRTAERFKQLFPNTSPEQVARAAGVVDGMHAHLEAIGNALKVVGFHEDGQSKVAAYYHPVEGTNGHLHQEISWNAFAPQHRGKGYQRFADQLNALDKLPQVKKITVPDAAGVAGSRMFNGYHTWPAYGFNAPLSERHKSLLSPETTDRLGPNPTFHALYATEEGSQEWKKNGAAVEDMEFDLHPDSEHRKRFRAYYDKRKQQESAGTGTQVRDAVPPVPPVAAPEEAHPYRTASRTQKAASAAWLRDRLRALRYKQEQKFSTVLLPVQGDLRQKVLELANKVPDHLLAGNGRETDPHLTLLYGLHSDDHQPIRDLFANAEGKIGFRLGKVGVFKNPDFDVLKLEVHSPDAHAANALLKTQPHTSTYPNYNPHLTLAYVKSGEGERLAKELGGLEGHSAESDRVIFSDPNRNHTPIPVGDAVTENPTKYATEQPVAHPSVAGFQLEHALRRAISDPETTSELKSLSHALLTEGVNRSDAAYGIHDEVESLPEDHWLRKANYNWSAIPHKLHLDAAMEAAVNVHSGPDAQTDPQQARNRTFDAFQDSLLGQADHPEGLKVLVDQGHSSADLEDSLTRVWHRFRPTEHREGPMGTQEFWQEDAEQPPEGTFWGPTHRYAAKGKNPEGGLTHEEARKQGVQPGSRTANAAKKAGGFSKIEGKTQKRRKSFCARACGQAKQFPKAANAPKSRLRSALRMWGCRCGASKNSTSEEPVKYAEGNYSPLISHAAAALDNPLNEGAVNSFLDHLQEQHPDDRGVQQFAEWAQGGDPAILRELHKEVLHDPRGATEDGRVQLNFQPRPRFDKTKEADLIFKGRNGSWLRGKKDTDDFEWDGTDPLTTAEVAQHLYDTGGPANLAFAVMAARHFSPERQAERKAGKREKSPTYYKAEPVKYQSPALSDFISAVRQIRSSNQEVRRQIAEQQYKKMGLSAQVRDAIADAPHTASANTAQAVEHNGDLDKVRAAAALYAQQTESPQLLLFHEHADGADLLHKFDAEGSAEKLRQQLDAAGLYNRTLSPTPTGWSAFFFDPKGQQHQKLLAFTQKAGYNLETSVGTGERVGDGQEAEANKENRSDYRQFIQQYEKQQGIR